MALDARTTWELRPSGSPLNSGGFNQSNGSAGTDYSQQVAAQFLRTDLLIGAANSLTSAAVPFTAAELGNLIHVTAGTNFTPGFYELASIVGAVVTLDRSPGTLAASGGTGRVGGALSTPNDTPAIAGGTVWMQAGAGYTTAGQYILNDGVGNGQFVVYAGYTTVRGDGGLATITASANLSPIVTAANQVIFKNFVIDGANTASRGQEMGNDCYVENVQVRRCLLSGMRALNDGTRIRRCLFTENGASDLSGGGLSIGTGVIASECEARGNAGNGFLCPNNSGDYLECVARGNTLSGFYQQGDDGMRLRSCVSYGNGGDGLELADTFSITTLQVVDCIFSGNTGRGVHSTTTDYTGFLSLPTAIFFQHNAFFGNTGGNYGQVPAGTGDIILTADPFTNAAGGDFSLNSAAGGGALLLGAGLPGGFGLLGAGALASTAHRDVGAVQTLGAAVVPVPTALATMRSLWREYTNELFTPGDANSAVPDSTVDSFLTYALESLNRAARYHVSDGSIALVAGQQEYSLPADFVSAQWLQYGSFRKLERSDVERWMSRGEDWRHDPQGEPQSWAIYSNKLIVRPIPSAEAVAAAPNLTLRYCSTPPSITTAGPEQLGSQEYRLVVLIGAYYWSVAFPESLVAQNRLAELAKMIEPEKALVIQQYAQRSIST